MQDVDDVPSLGRRRLSAVPAERAAPVVTRHRGSVVPATRLLEVASALSDGATKLHAQLRHLEPAERDALLDAVTDQVTVIMGLWADLVRGVVSSDEPATVPTEDAARERPARERPARDLPAGDEVDDSPSGGPDHDETFVPDIAGRVAAVEHQARARAVGDHPARVSTAMATPAEPPSGVRRPAGQSSKEAERFTRDELTGVLNRQAGFGALGREIERCRRSGERFVLGYLNVDGMKALNDSRGTRAGDELLRKVTAALRATLRSYDVIARLGGDEFLFSLPGADLSTADLRFKEFAVILTEEAPGSSASVGFAELHQQDTLDDLVVSAETAMLKARRTRRRGRG